MFTTATIAFREFLEAFLIIGVFLGVSKKLQLKKEMEISIAAVIGLIISLVLNIGVFMLGDHAGHIVTERNADALESYLQVFSGFFVAYVVFSLHNKMNQNRKETMQKAQEQMARNVFDISLVLTIIFLIVREGFEIALFTASISLFSQFLQNFIGLIIGFVCAAIIGCATFFAYTKFSVNKIFKATEYMIILLGASLFQTGITKFFDTHFNILLSNLGSFHLQFLPDEDSFVGGFLQGFFGIDQDFSFFRLLIMIVYIGIIYSLFFKKSNASKESSQQKTVKNIAITSVIGSSVVGIGMISAFAFSQQPEQKPTTAAIALQQVNLVSSVAGIAPNTDTNLTDAWGMEFGHSGRIWVNTSSGYSTVYDGTGKIVKAKNPDTPPLAVQVPTPANATDPAPLTGIIFSETDAFAGDSFVFVTEQGTIAGWHKNADGTEPLTATMRVDNSADGAVYKGVTAAKTNYGWLLYVTNFAKNRIDIFDSSYKKVLVLGGFSDPNLPKEYAPFNIKNINGELYVTYAQQSIDKQNDVHGVGNGYVDIFTTNGEFVKRLISKGDVNSPWGLAVAPDNFGNLSNDLLIGNFGDGHIIAFNKDSGKEIGMVTDDQGNTLQIDGLWSLTFGTNNGAGKSNQLFFAAGPSAEDQGLFGRLDPVTTK